MAGNRKIKLAIFDIDGTIFRSSLIIESLNGLIEKKVFSKTVLTKINKDYLAWLNRKGSYNEYLMQVVRAYYESLKGKQPKPITIALQHVLKIHKDRVYRFTRNLIEELKKQNFQLIAISHSPENIVEPFAKYLGFDTSFGTRLEIKNNVYTGRRFDGNKFSLEYSVVSPKDQTLQQFITEKNLHIDWKNSIAVGDTEGDIPLFNLVGNPIVFNPSQSLAKLAKKKGWTMVVERKDVIYKIREAKFI
ncbi:MAG: HAD family phosphatase [Candidatus Yanofskybacteria bacterium]|nr:HAD family phosphatase [Candidatus Yanofskybacteria bacterium]